MISKEQIAHDLAMVYMNNRYGIDVTGSFSISDGDGSGMVITERLPHTTEAAYVKVKTGEKGIFGIEKKEKVRSGEKVDKLFFEMTAQYYAAYSKFLKILLENEMVDDQ